MKGAACMAAVLAVAMLGTATEVEFDSLDPFVVGVWHYQAGLYAKHICDQQDPDGNLKCFLRLPACRSLLYWVNGFNDEKYELFVKYLGQCSDETNSNLNMTGVPATLAEWQEQKQNGLRFKHDTGMPYEKMPKLFACLHAKFNNVNAFKDCINAS